MKMGDLIAIGSSLAFVIAFIWKVIIPFIQDWKRDNKREIVWKEKEQREKTRNEEIINSIPKKDFYKWKLKMFEVKQLFDNLNRNNQRDKEIKNEIYLIMANKPKYKSNSTYVSLIKEQELISKQNGNIRKQIDLKLSKLDLNSTDFLNVIYELAKF